MAYYAITYDLKEGQDYAPLIKALKTHDGVRASESFWLVELGDPDASTVRDYFKGFLPTPAKDKLMVIEFAKRPRFTVAFSGAVDWIQARFA